MKPVAEHEPGGWTNTGDVQQKHHRESHAARHTAAVLSMTVQRHWEAVED